MTTLSKADESGRDSAGASPKGRTDGGIAESVAGAEIVSALRSLHVSHVVTVPDTHQMSVLEDLKDSSDPRLLTVCTEDEAVAINMGLYIAGLRPTLLIQNRGLYASMNSLLGLALDGGVPTFMVVGQLFRDVSMPADASPLRAVHLAERTLETWKIPYRRLEGRADLDQIREAYEIAQSTRGPAVVLVGAPTI